MGIRDGPPTAEASDHKRRERERKEEKKRDDFKRCQIKYVANVFLCLRGCPVSFYSAFAFILFFFLFYFWRRRSEDPDESERVNSNQLNQSPNHQAVLHNCFNTIEEFILFIF